VSTQVGFELIHFSPLGEGSAADQVSAALRDDIIHGRLKPGMRLKDAELAARFDVSRNTLRDAVKQLATDGLISLRRNAGGTVRQLSETDVRDIYTVRRTLEISGVTASSKLPEAQLEGIDLAIRRASELVANERWDELETASLQFHQAFVALNGSERMDKFFANILAQLRLVYAVMVREPDFQLKWLQRDQQIARLIMSGQRTEANALLSEYLDDSESIIIDTIRSIRAAKANDTE
jgi:DNA-binding GntR family transcriptional regulator